MSGIFSSTQTNLRRMCKTGLFAAGMSLVAHLSVAQTALNEVRLEAVDGSVTIKGDLVAFDDGIYSIQTEIGLINISETAVTCSGSGCPQNPATVSGDVVNNAVRLVSANDGTEVAGELIEFINDTYTVQTARGPVQFGAATVDCFGVACPQVVASDNPSFTVAGGQYAVGSLIPEMLRGFARNNGMIYDVATSADGENTIRLLDARDGSVVADIAIDVSTPSAAFASFASRSADIAIVDQGLPPVMWQNVAQEYLIANDALVLVTHNDNPVRDLSLAQAGQIWAGQIESWRALGGDATPVSVHMTLEENNSVPAVFQQRILQENGLTNQNLGAVVVHPTARDVTNAVLADRNAVGIVSRGAAQAARTNMLDIRKSCGLTAAPSDFELKVQNYPLTRPVLAYIATRDPHPIAVQFLKWSKLNEAQSSVAGAGFGGDQLQRMQLSDMGAGLIQTVTAGDFDADQFADMLRELQNADRLSITFRFQRGSSLLDNESVAFIQDLATRLRGNEFDGSEVLLVGFADSSGAASRNTLLAQRRAEAVRNILLREFDAATAQRQNLQTLSFGEQMPLDCNTSDTGRANNRRVEIWVRAPQ